MAIYSPGRRRTILLLLLTSILLLTLDLRGNAIFEAARNGFDKVLEPFETAAEVVSEPIENAWHGITDYERVAEENRRLREENEAQTADLVSARAVIIEDQYLRELNDLESLAEFPTVIATVVGQGPTNIDQIVEIDKGSDDGVEVGMPVLSTAGLIGKVTAPVEPNRARIMLMTDSRFTIDVKIVPAAPIPTTTTSTTVAATTTTISAGPLPSDVPTTTALPADTTTTSSTSTTIPTPPAETTTTTTAVPESTAVTTTTIDTDLVRETGGLSGQGEGELPSVSFLDNTPVLGRFEVGDLVFTSGSQDSLAPANIPIGRVVNVIDRSTSEGPMLEIEPFADLDSLYFVRVVLYRPGIEASD